MFLVDEGVKFLRPVLTSLNARLENGEEKKSDMIAFQHKPWENIALRY